MKPNCRGCKHEYEVGLEMLEQGYDVAWGGLGERRHLFIAVLDKEGRFILF